MITLHETTAVTQGSNTGAEQSPINPQSVEEGHNKINTNYKTL